MSARTYPFACLSGLVLGALAVLCTSGQGPPGPVSSATQPAVTKGTFRAGDEDMPFTAEYWPGGHVIDARTTTETLLCRPLLESMKRIDRAKTYEEVADEYTPRL